MRGLWILGGGGSQLVEVAEEVEMPGLRIQSRYVEDRKPSIYIGVVEGFNMLGVGKWVTMLGLRKESTCTACEWGQHAWVEEGCGPIVEEGVNYQHASKEKETNLLLLGWLKKRSKTC
jgi:hypothetical protein